MTNVKTGLYAPRPCRWVVQGSDRKQAGLITKMCYPYVDNQNCEIPVFYQTRQKEPLVLRVLTKPKVHKSSHEEATKNFRNSDFSKRC